MLTFGAGCSGSGLLKATALFDRRQAVVDGVELALDVVELHVEVSDELVEGVLEVTIVAVGTHGNGVGSNRSLRYQV